MLFAPGIKEERITKSLRRMEIEGRFRRSSESPFLNLRLVENDGKYSRGAFPPWLPGRWPRSVTPLIASTPPAPGGPRLPPALGGRSANFGGWKVSYPRPPMSLLGETTLPPPAPRPPGLDNKDKNL